MMKQIKLFWLLLLVGGTLPTDLTDFFNKNMKSLTECNFEHETVQRFANEIKSIIESPNLSTIQFGGSCNTESGFIYDLHQKVAQLFSMLPSNHPERLHICGIIVNFHLLCAKIKEAKLAPETRPKTALGARSELPHRGTIEFGIIDEAVDDNLERKPTENLVDYFNRIIKKIHNPNFTSAMLQEVHAKVKQLHDLRTLDGIEFGGETNTYEEFIECMNNYKVPPSLQRAMGVLIYQIIDMFEKIATRINEVN